MMIAKQLQSHDMCIVHYVVYPDCGCNHIHRPPTLCNNASKSQQPQKRFEERIITFHPDLKNLVLRRDNYLIESHSVSSGIENDSQICSDAIKRAGVPEAGCWDHVATSKHPDLPKTSCPLCGLQKDVIMVMEDAANGCEESAARISESKVMSRKRREARDRILRLRELQEDLDMPKGGKEKPEEDEDQSGSDPDSIKW